VRAPSPTGLAALNMFVRLETRRPAEVDSPSNSEGSLYAVSDDETDAQDREDKRLLVHSTISRDTTQNTPAVDSIDLSKIASHTDDLPLNTRDAVLEGSGPLPPGASPLVAPPPGFGPPPGPPWPSARLGPLYGVPNVYDVVDNSRVMPAPPPIPRNPLPALHLNPGYPGPPAPTSILAKITPGKDLRTLFQETWSDRPRLASYNWRDKLRITSRRKSESDLAIYRGTDHDSRISQHLPPNASNRRLVANWKLAGHQMEEKSDGVLSRRIGDGRPMRETGAYLGRMAERHLGLDLYEDSQQSMFFSHLIDVIEALRAERDFLNDLLTRPQEVRPLPRPPPPPKAPEPKSASKVVPRFNILHRVFCKAPKHLHD
jgi:hypothetical protein